MAAGQLSGRVHLLPANGTVVRVLLQVRLAGEWVALLHVIEDPQVIAVPLELALDLVDQEAQLHYYHETGHRQEDVAPEQLQDQRRRRLT